VANISALRVTSRHTISHPNLRLRDVFTTIFKSSLHLTLLQMNIPDKTTIV